MRKIIILLLLLALGFAINSQAQQVSSAEYFINTDPGPGNGMAIPITASGSIDESYSISTSGLPQGNHTLYVRTRGDDGLWSLVKSMPFYLQDTVQDIPQIETRSIVAAEYFIDEDPGMGKGTAISVNKLTAIESAFSISTSGFTPGAHSVYVRTLDNKGLWSLALERQFAVMPNEVSYPVPLFTNDTVDAGIAMSFTNLSDSVNANTTYEWDIMNDGSVEYTDENVTHTFENTGIFPVKLTATNDTLTASYISNVIVGDFEDIMLAADGPLQMCEGETVTLSAPAGYSYEWNTGDTSQSIMVGASGTYFAWLTDANGLAVKSETLTVDVTDTFNASVHTENAALGMTNGFAKILADEEISGLTFSWSTGDTNSYVSDLAVGSYNVTITKEQCTSELTFSIDEVTPISTDIVTAEYFWNSDPGPGQGTAINVSTGDNVSFSQQITTEGLVNGNHKLYIRTRNNDGLWSLAQTMSVYVQDTVSNEVVDPDRFIVAAEYFVDTDPGVGNGITIPVNEDAQMLVDQIDISEVDYSSGDHVLYVRTLDDTGQWSIAASAPFNVCGLLPAEPTIADENICYGNSISLTASGVTGNTYRWFTADSVLIENQTNAAFNTDVLYADTTYYVAQVDAAGCQSQMSDVNVGVQQLDVFAGIDETLSKAGPDYQLAAYYPAGGSWSGSSLSTEGLLTRSNLNESTYEMTYSVDSAGCTFNDTKEIAILDLSEEYEITIEENPATGLVLFETELSDISQYLVIDGAAEGININASGEITVADSTLFDFEAQTVMNWTVEAMKDVHIYYELNLIVNLTDGDDPPLMADQSFTIDENSPAGTIVGSIVATDQDSPTLLYNIESGNAGSTFEIQNTNSLVVNDSTLLDYESATQFELVVSVTDGFFTAYANITVNLNDVEEGNSPVIEDQTFAVDENSAAGTTVGTIVATDLDDDPLAFSIISGNTNDAFALNSSSGVLSVNNTEVLDYETTPIFNLVVEVDDNVDGTDQAIITVNLNDVGEGNSPVIEDQTFAVDENSAAGTTVGTIVATDLDDDPLAFSIISGNTNDAFALNSSSGVLSVNNTEVLDYETTPIFNLVVEVDDNVDGTDQAIITVNLNDVEEGNSPVIEDQTFAVDENSAAGTTVGTIVATDLDDDPLAFSIISGNTNDAFALNSSSGVLSVNNTEVLDYETTPIFNLVVEVDDNVDGTDQAIITVNLNDVEEGNSPVIEDQTFAVDENSAAGTTVGTIVATDLDDDPLAFSIISGNTNDAFALNSSSGVLSVNNSEALDYETTPIFNLVVEVDDNVDGTDQAIITVNLNDVGEGNSPVIEDQTFAVDENSAAGTTVGTIVATDLDDDPLVFSIISGNTNDAFALNSSSGVLSVNNTEALDYETTPAYYLIVEVDDNVDGTDQAIITVNLNGGNSIFSVDKGSLIRTYPNPAKKYVMIDFQDLYDSRLVLQIISVNGKVVYNENIDRVQQDSPLAIDLSGVSAGIYIVSIHNESKTIFKKIIVE